jgi:translation initiation factor IF-2
LLDKKRAMESGIKGTDKPKQDIDLSAVYTSDLSDTEVDARLNAIKNAKRVASYDVPFEQDVPDLPEPDQEQEQLQDFPTQGQQEAEESGAEQDVPPAQLQSSATINNTEQNENHGQELAEIQPKIPAAKLVKRPAERQTARVEYTTRRSDVQPNGEINRKQRNPYKNAEHQPTTTSDNSAKTSVILRAASYGPGKKQKEEEERKKVESSGKKNPTDHKEDRKKGDRRGPTVVRAPQPANDGKVQHDRARVRKAVDGADLTDVSSRRWAKKGAQEPRKLTRRVLTRVMEGEDEDRTRSVAAYRRAQKKQSIAAGHGQKTGAVKVVRDVVISETIAVSELANRMAVSSGELIKGLMRLGVMVSINQVIDGDTAELICGEFGHRAKRVSNSDIEIGLRRESDSKDDLQPRSPVVAVMGHVDHGKTSLLDALRRTDVVSREFGGITQHISAYQIVTRYSDTKITFIDTPGHAAFSEMRTRGAGITDIVVFVVAADDNVNERTIEAITPALAAKVPIIVAINKIDKTTADPERIRNELLKYGIVTEEFGGDVMAVEISAKNETNLDKLIEAILLQAELLELKASYTGHADGVVIEATVDKGCGVTTTVLVQRGTLRLGDILVAGAEFGRVKTMINSYGEKIKEAEVSCPVEILGFNGVPLAGDEFFVVEEEAKAREVSEHRKRLRREKEILLRNKNSVEHMMNRIAEQEVEGLSIILKTDVQGTLEAITNSINRLVVDGVLVRFIHRAIGDINETDVMLAKASNAVILGFNIKATPQAKNMADREGITLCHHSVVYELLDNVEKIMKGRLAPTFEEKKLGRAEVRVVFSKGKVIKIAGCYVVDGLIRRANSQIRLLRGNTVVFEGKIDTMKREKDDIKESKEGYECGIILDGCNDIKESDIIECFEIVEKRAI